MEFDIRVLHGLRGHVEIIDTSNEIGEYIPEYDTDTDVWGKYKYSESVTLNVITQITTNSVKVLDVLISNHDEADDIASFDLNLDGYYLVTHLVLPNKKWVNNHSNLNNELIYFIVEDDVIKKIENGEVKDTTIAELLYISNPNISNLQKCLVDIFYTGYLRDCYINYSKKYLDKLMSRCKTKCATGDEDEYSRDFLLMTLNILKYLVEFNHFMEALRILEEINYCGGFCKDVRKQSGCGCQKRPVGCGCSQA